MSVVPGVLLDHVHHDPAQTETCFALPEHLPRESRPSAEARAGSSVRVALGDAVSSGTSRSRVSSGRAPLPVPVGVPDTRGQRQLRTALERPPPPPLLDPASGASSIPPSVMVDGACARGELHVRSAPRPSAERRAEVVEVRPQHRWLVGGGRLVELCARTPAHGHSPAWPSTASRIRSAWPLWRAYSSIMWAGSSGG